MLFCKQRKFRAKSVPVPKSYVASIGCICSPIRAASRASRTFSKSQTSEFFFLKGESCAKGTKNTFFLCKSFAIFGADP